MCLFYMDMAAGKAVSMWGVFSPDGSLERPGRPLPIGGRFGKMQKA